MEQLPASIECPRCGTVRTLPETGRVECAVCGQLLVVDAARQRAALSRGERMCDRCFDPHHEIVHCACGCPSAGSYRRVELIKSIAALPITLPVLAIELVHVGTGRLLRRFFGELGR